MKRIAHLTSVHPRTDTRVFKKQCQSLARSGEYQLFLIVSDGLGDDLLSEVNILDVGASKTRLSRIFFAPLRVFYRSLKVRAHLYHLHDPELMLIGVLLKLVGKKVVFDAHENFRKQLLSKPYLRPLLSRLISFLILPLELISFKVFDHVITATPSICDDITFLRRDKKTVVNNFPMLEEFSFSDSSTVDNNSLVYVGAITRIRGLKELINALPKCDGIKLDLIGGCNDADLLEEMKSLEGWSFVTYHGHLPSVEAFQKVRNSLAGIVTYLPYPNHTEAQPNKLFEYMAAGIPVIASNFPLWREIVETDGAGVCVDPESPEEISKAITFLSSHLEQAKSMGYRGKEIVKKKYNWSAQEKILLGVYDDILMGDKLYES